MGKTQTLGRIDHPLQAFHPKGCRLFFSILSQNVLNLICSNVEFQKFSLGHSPDHSFNGRGRGGRERGRREIKGRKR